MARVIKEYNNPQEYRSDPIKNTHRSLHQDFTEIGKLKVTWVNGADDPGATVTKRDLTQANFIKELAEQNNVRLI